MNAKKFKKFLTNRTAYDKLNKLSEKQNKCSSKEMLLEKNSTLTNKQ